MSSSLRRGALAASAIAFSIASLAACGAGNDAQTLEIKPDNAAAQVGEIKLQNVVVITQPDLESTGPAVVSATVFNADDEPQTLDSITVDGTGKSAELKPAKGKGELTVPAHGSLVIGGAGNASAVLPDSREAVKNGDAQNITFTFSKTGAVKLAAFVVPAEGYFSDWGPSKIPTASPSPSKSAAASESASADGGTESGSPSPSGSASASASNSAAAGN
ncbi:copper(I)-binding protein [Streptomyces achromogenes]|uniref:Copper(I)-binding protein n=1 Tax=Streptomyces achromogenes TaxID=67255 RepID=A0ABU0Q1V9_STRAH|nr:DUF461 domain-containing protein [Streptomyces achromogenes]MDQ0684627.1 copper(I)-binding protein [Streptomyces achromogenes]MDQ0831793.1 copper(I)-binding protein [Streptomyces achromogenes]